jgi:hypothetical protein
MKKLIFNLFVWTIDIHLHKKENKDKIGYLVKKLTDEIKSQGYPVGNPNGKDISIWIHTYPDIKEDKNIVYICNLGGGKLDLKIKI